MLYKIRKLKKASRSDNYCKDPGSGHRKSGLIADRGTQLIESLADLALRIDRHRHGTTNFSFYTGANRGLLSANDFVLVVGFVFIVLILGLTKIAITGGGIAQVRV